MALHWTIDHRHRYGDFESELRETLSRGIAAEELSASTTRSYAILPNFWCGYKPVELLESDPKLTYGHVALSRRNEGEGWSWSVRISDDISGEMQRLSYRTAPSLEMVDAFQVEVSNSSDGSYRAFRCDGRVRDLNTSRSICLQLNDRLLTNAVVDMGARLLCNWSLFELIPRLARENRSAGNIAVFHDLQRLSLRNRAQFFDRWRLETDVLSLDLVGYRVFGEGNPPSYWWVTSEGVVCIMSDIFRTFVLSEQWGEEQE